MKRSTQIGLAAAGIVLVATVWSLSGGEDEEQLVYADIAECRAAGVLGEAQCSERYNEAQANHVRDAKKFASTSACETEYGAGSCRTTSWNGAQVVIPALAGFMLARHLSQGGGAARPLLPPTQQACPPNAQSPECQQARSSSSGGGGGYASGSGRSRAYSTSSGDTVVTRPGPGGGAVATAPGVASRGGFGSMARSFSSSSGS